MTSDSSPSSAGERSYWVTSPSYTYVEVVLDDGTGPTYETTDWLEVVATSKREAVGIAVKKWLAEPLARHSERNWCQSQRQDGLCPYTGVRAEIARCPHGVEEPVGFFSDGWEDEHDEWWCDDCREEWKAHSDV